jgi:hypothetical protein
MTKLRRLTLYSFLILNFIALAGCDRSSSSKDTKRLVAEPSSIQAPIKEGADRIQTNRLNAFLDRVYERNVAAWPERETALGRKTEQQGEWNDYIAAPADLDERQLWRLVAA